MPNILIYNPDSTPVANRVTAYYRSRPLVEFENEPNKLIDPVLPEGEPLSNLKVSGSDVVVLSAQDLSDIADATAAEVAAAAAALLAQQRTIAKEYIQDKIDEQGLVIRALALVVLDEINTLRTAVTTIHPAANLTERTGVQLRNAIQGRIDDESADSI